MGKAMNQVQIAKEPNFTVWPQNKTANFFAIPWQSRPCIFTKTPHNQWIVQGVKNSVKVRKEYEW